MRKNSVALFVLVAIAVWGGPTKAQHLRLGVIGGTAVTRDYTTTYTPEMRFVLEDGREIVVPMRSNGSGPRGPIGGPTLEWAFNERFSVETNAIYRRLRQEEHGPTVTWEFPVLAKYRLPLGGFAPFVEAGPSFRTTGNRNTNPSHLGLTAGAGLDWRWRGIRFAPTFRYTRWKRDVWWTHPSKQDQVEALFAVSRGGVTDRRPFSGRVRLGILAGGMLVRPVRRTSFVAEGPDGSRFDQTRSSLRMWTAGPRVEADIGMQWSLSAEANYRQARFRTVETFDVVGPDGVRRQGQRVDRHTNAVFWQFPVLARRSFGDGALQPYLEAGPSFRLPQDLGGEQATLGATGGAGVRFRLGAFHVQPGLRFTHWGPAHDRNGDRVPNETRRNQLDAVVAVTF